MNVTGIVTVNDLSEFDKLDTALGLLASQLSRTTRSTKEKMAEMFAAVAMSISLRKRCLASKIPALIVISKNDKSFHDYLITKSEVWEYAQWM